ncbi:MAG: ribonuclease III [Butyrivibrio sp.]|nr:ribonuclease III [Butyrivibrio sp.]
MADENKDLREFEKKIGYTFRDTGLLELALTHSSYGNEIYHDKHHNNERLEFLGDAVLEITVSEYIFEKYDTEAEGELTKLRASIVCEPTLAFCAREIGLNDMIYLGRGEELTGGRFRDSIISDAFEAVLGAIYRDGGIECAKEFVKEHVLKDIDRKKLFVDSKSILQEKVQADGLPSPEYELIRESGPDHCKEFTVRVIVDGKTVGEGSGRTKKAAEQQAAYNAILEM